MQKISKNAEFGKHLRKMRLNKGFGVSELARHFQLIGCDTTRECIVKIESGTHNVSLEQLKAYKQAFNTTYNEIFEFLEKEGE
ncbi:MAG: helix-turn-helix domain-containing protein [Ruminococcus sp.]